ncbi:MAG: cyclic nucleotide-binding domain-containing protein [Chloroflexi bacterium]|nr:cyclic nucleotide-binding domain-containing protein [Chloroflexota bacterium]
MAKQLLKEYDFFKELTVAEEEKVLALAARKEYPAGAIIFREGQRAEELLLLEEGKVVLQMQVRAAQSSSYRKATIDFVTPGEMLGWSAIVEPNIYTLTAVSLGRAQVLTINGPKLKALMQNDLHIGQKLLAALVKVIASRLADTRELLVSERLVIGELG